jgi:hypothetical protein
MNGALTELETSYKKQAQNEAFRLTDRERNAYKLIVGGLIGETLTDVVMSPDYAKLPDEAKADVLRNERNQARKAGVEMFKAFAKDTIEPRVRKLSGR